METLDLLRKLPKPTSERDAWSYGVDCALNGANTENSHFRIFRTKERTDAWTAGKKSAEEYLSENGSSEEPGGPLNERKI